MTERVDVEFNAIDGTRLAAWLFRPANATKPLPAVTMAHGFSATRYHGIEPLARAFADAGFVVLLHDHRNFGGSGGEPRHDIDPWRQIEDWRQAISYLETLDDVDPLRIGLWGTSYSGGHAIVLGATDRRLKAVVTQVPTIDGFAAGQRRVNPASLSALEESFNEDQRAQLKGAPPRRQKLVDPDPSVAAQYHTPDTVKFLTQDVPPGMWQNDITIQSNRRARMYEPGRWIDRVSPTPLLMIAVTHDTTAPTDLALAAYERALEPKSLVLMPGGHYSTYLEGFETASRAAIEWFARHL
ncbi:alpha/beta hydrolase [Nguyenibacter vanlangensis]|uniref:Alpha/beta fold hydrolase n=1 Tax=Nguyenibacter vanlangensis TaxID=1216886 RepID=A0A7Y7M5L3_9PROT|nr:alpha/beta fold hydrolase [Nguyenibacter vanlangensis]NVN09623.1 alpha/beta fold hydrolase [Nguyenibacter vanlangensis]